MVQTHGHTQTGLTAEIVGRGHQTNVHHVTVARVAIVVGVGEEVAHRVIRNFEEAAVVGVSRSADDPGIHEGAKSYTGIVILLFHLGTDVPAGRDGPALEILAEQAAALANSGLLRLVLLDVQTLHSATHRHLLHRLGRYGGPHQHEGGHVKMPHGRFGSFCDEQSG